MLSIKFIKHTCLPSFPLGVNGGDWVIPKLEVDLKHQNTCSTTTSSKAVLLPLLQDLNHVVVQTPKHQAFQQLIFYMDITKADFSQCSLAESYVQTQNTWVFCYKQRRCHISCGISCSPGYRLWEGKVLFAVKSTHYNQTFKKKSSLGEKKTPQTLKRLFDRH